MHAWFPTFRRLADSSGSFRSWWPLRTTTAQRQALMRLIAVATEEHLPLAPLVECWAEDEQGVQRRRLDKLVRLLKQGRPLAEAVELVPGVLDEEDLLAIRFDAQSGTRTAAIRQRLENRWDCKTGAASDAVPRLARSLQYLAVLVPICLLLVVFMQTKIVPVFLKIFAEFGMELPPALAWSARSSGGFVGWWLVLVLALVALAWWLLATRGGRSIRYALFGRLLRPWHEWRAAGVLQNIAIAASAGRPITGALSTLARYHFDPAIRHELLFVRNEVEQGADVWSSLARVGMVTSDEVHLLARAQQHGHLPWVLQKLVANKKTRTSQRLEWAAEFAMPLFVFAIAALVVIQALTVFQPLTHIIDHLA